VVLDFRALWPLRGALPEKRGGLLVDATLVEDPAQRVRDARVVGRDTFCCLGELERPFLVSALLREEPGQVVRGGGEARVHGQRLLECLPGLAERTLLLVYG